MLFLLFLTVFLHFFILFCPSSLISAQSSQPASSAPADPDAALAERLDRLRQDLASSPATPATTTTTTKPSATRIGPAPTATSANYLRLISGMDLQDPDTVSRRDALDRAVETFCCICTEDAVLKCVDCGMDPYCARCFKGTSRDHLTSRADMAQRGIQRTIRTIMRIGRCQ